MTDPPQADAKQASPPPLGWLAALTVAASVALPMTVFGPAELYARNAGEFTVSFGAVLVRLLPVAGAALLVLAWLIRALPARARVWALGFGLALGGALYAQGKVLDWDYGQFDGVAIDWAAYRWHGTADLAVWLSLLAAGALARRSLARNAALLGGALLAVQAVSAVIEVQGGDVTWREQRGDFMDDASFELSARRNAVVIVLDAFKTPIFEHVMDRHPRLAAEFSGFTFFRDATGVLSTTWMSIPAMLTGRVYHNEVPAGVYLERVFARESLVSVLGDRGYRTDLVTLKRYCKLLAADSCMTPGELASTDRGALKFAETARLADLTLFRYLPQAVKRKIYSGGQLLLSSRLAPGAADINWHLSDALGAADILSERLHLADRPGALKFIHLMIPHHPYHLDGNCRPLAVRSRQERASSELFHEQGECAVRLTVRLLQTLKSLDAYDQSAILVTADHGFADREYYDSAEAFARRGLDRALPLLLVKPPGATGEMKVSSAPATNADIARTVTELLGVDHDFPGHNVMALNEGAARARRYYHYVWRGGWWGSDYLPPVQEYVLEGDPRDPSAWREGGRFVPKDRAADSEQDH